MGVMIRWGVVCVCVLKREEEEEVKRESTKNKKNRVSIF